jgi:archaellin
MPLSASGEIGIGNLMMLITIMLVATITGGVLITTTQKVAQQAKKTALQAINTVSTGISIINIVGDRNTDSNPSLPPNSTIQVLELKVELFPGSPAIDFDDLLIQVSDGNKTADLVLNVTGTTAEHATATQYVAIAIRDIDGTFDDKIMNQGDIIKIIISTDTDATDLNLTTNRDITIRLIPKHGLLTTSKLVTPSVYTTRYVELY